MPESESAKLFVMVVMVMIIILVMLVMVIMAIRTDKKNRTTRTNGTGNLCRAAFEILAMFYTWYDMNYSLNLGRERATQQLIVCRHNRGQRRS